MNEYESSTGSLKLGFWSCGKPGEFYTETTSILRYIMDNIKTTEEKSKQKTETVRPAICLSVCLNKGPLLVLYSKCLTASKWKQLHLAVSATRVIGSDSCLIWFSRYYYYGSRDGFWIGFEFLCKVMAVQD